MSSGSIFPQTSPGPLSGNGRSWKVWLEAARPRTLPAAVAPVLVGTGLAYHDGALVVPAAAACLGFALLVQIGTNFANDYFDFVKGADTAERLGPRRAVAAGLVAPVTMRRATILTFAAAFVVGLTLLPFGGWPLLVIGLVSIACGVLYTGGPYPLAYHGWGDVFVFVFFGLVAVGATYFVQTGQVTTEAWLAGAGVGALATNILLVNNYRDRSTDAKAGKRTLVVRWGTSYAKAQFVGCHLLALAVPLALFVRGALSAWAAVPVVLVGAAVALAQTRRLVPAAPASALIQLLGRTGRYVAVYAALLTLGLLA